MFTYGSSAEISFNEDEAHCSFSVKDLTLYPHCLQKMSWMKRGWLQDNCYKAYGVNGSFCSFRIYLSEVEKYCPPFETHQMLQSTTPPKIATMQPNVSKLFELMYDNEVNYKFIKDRIARLWSKWLNAYYELERTSSIIQQRTQLKIVMHLGFLNKETGFKFGELSASGGPLGELVQWSDLIACLYLLGHDIVISTEISTLKIHLKDYSADSPCPLPVGGNIDLIFTDIVGVRYMRRKLSTFFQKSKCALRVLDTFGTHAEFNLNSYFVPHKKELGTKKTNPWGGSELNLQQFMTMYPHTDDNTFLGFVVEMHDVNISLPRKNATLVYGKMNYMWQNANALIETVANLSEVHATVADTLDGSFQVINHGFLPGPDLHALMRSMKIFLGLGFPYEGPAPLEAIASGAVYINPLFNPPKSRKTHAFFAEKPTLRELTSQNPYVEKFIGKPHVLTVDIANLTAVRDAVIEALSSKPSAYLPFEFTAAGMLQRVDVLISKQNFCWENKFPPQDSMKVLLAGAYQSCQDACRAHGLLCERSFFRHVNDQAYINRDMRCNEITAISDPVAPYQCYSQKEPLLFSCASLPKFADTRRICPCRDYHRNQSALCSRCL